MAASRAPSKIYEYEVLPQLVHAATATYHATQRRVYDSKKRGCGQRILRDFASLRGRVPSTTPPSDDEETTPASRFPRSRQSAWITVSSIFSNRAAQHHVLQQHPDATYNVRAELRAEGGPCETQYISQQKLQGYGQPALPQIKPSNRSASTIPNDGIRFRGRFWPHQSKQAQPEPSHRSAAVRFIFARAARESERKADRVEPVHPPRASVSPGVCGTLAPAPTQLKPVMDEVEPNDGAPSRLPAANSNVRPGHALPFVAPSSYLRPKTRTRTISMSEPTPMSPVDEEQLQGLKGLREFLKRRTSYDVLPLSFRLIVLDNDLLIKKSLNILIQNGIVSAPLWDSHTSRFAGLLTSTDYINVIQYYCQFPNEIDNVEKFRLSSLREIEKAIGVQTLETVSVHPSRPLYEACNRMLKSRARRIPLVDIDDETGRETVVSVITQYRILKFIAVNTEQHTSLLKKSVREIRLGTYENIATCQMSDSVLDVINLMVVHNISAVPVLDKNDTVLNVFEAVDVIPCIKGGAYDELKSPVGEALCKRPDDFQGIYTCTEDDRLDSIFQTIRQSRVHRIVVIDDRHHLRGIISLSDILKYVLFHGEDAAYFPPS
ncbi:nuclear protein snf4 [Seiridium cupressi]